VETSPASGETVRDRAIERWTVESDEAEGAMMSTIMEVGFCTKCRDGGVLVGGVPALHDRSPP
jgi:hypothetical protein